MQKIWRVPLLFIINRKFQEKYYSSMSIFHYSRYFGIAFGAETFKRGILFNWSTLFSQKFTDKELKTTLGALNIEPKCIRIWSWNLFINIFLKHLISLSRNSPRGRLVLPGLEDWDELGLNHVRNFPNLQDYGSQPT